MNTEIINAIRNQNVITFDYEGESRTVEPHIGLLKRILKKKFVISK